MDLVNIRHFSQYEPGDTVTVPDGAGFDEFHWQPADGTPPPPPPDEPAAAAAAVAQFPQPAPKEM